MAKNEQPINTVIWRSRDTLKANDYNPNRVAPPELKLLKISILSDGWTQPIVINNDYTIVDGFHRWTVSGDPEVSALTDGLVPTVMLQGKTRADKQMATIRHNRARGTHIVVEMSNIVKEMIDQGLTGKEIQEKLQMEKEEVIRLLQRSGIPKSDVFKDKDFSKSWKPKGAHGI